MTQISFKIALILSVKNMTAIILLMWVFLMNVDLNMLYQFQNMTLQHALVLVHEQISFKFLNIVSSVHINPFFKKKEGTKYKVQRQNYAFPLPQI